MIDFIKFVFSSLFIAFCFAVALFAAGAGLIGYLSWIAKDVVDYYFRRKLDHVNALASTTAESMLGKRNVC